MISWTDFVTDDVRLVPTWLRDVQKKIEVAARSGDLLLDLTERSHKRYFSNLIFQFF